MTHIDIPFAPGRTRRVSVADDAVVILCWPQQFYIHSLAAGFWLGIIVAQPQAPTAGSSADQSVPDQE